MKAIVFTKYGSPDRLHLAQVPKPAPKNDEVLIKVRASSINAWDWEFQSGLSLVSRLMFGLRAPKKTKRVLGADVAGTVEAAGKRVTRFQPGDAVFGDLWNHWGGFAEYVCAREGGLERKPGNITFEQAAAVPQAGVLALQGLRTRRIGRGNKVLINGAGGGVGSFAVQIAKLAGAEVTGVDAVHKLNAVRAIGADHVIDYGQEDFTQNGQRYDLILDVHGFRSMFDYKRALSPTGTYAMVGGAMPRILQALVMGAWATITNNGKRFRLVAAGPNKGLAELSDLVASGSVVPLIDRRYHLDEVPQAFRYFIDGRHTGKVVICI